MRVLTKSVILKKQTKSYLKSKEKSGLSFLNIS